MRCLVQSGGVALNQRKKMRTTLMFGALVVIFTTPIEAQSRAVRTSAEYQVPPGAKPRVEVAGAIDNEVVPAARAPNMNTQEQGDNASFMALLSRLRSVRESGDPREQQDLRLEIGTQFEQAHSSRLEALSGQPRAAYDELLEQMYEFRGYVSPPDLDDAASLTRRERAALPVRTRPVVNSRPLPSRQESSAQPAPTSGGQGAERACTAAQVEQRLIRCWWGYPNWSCVRGDGSSGQGYNYRIAYIQNCDVGAYTRGSHTVPFNTEGYLDLETRRCFRTVRDAVDRLCE